MPVKTGIHLRPRIRPDKSGLAPIAFSSVTLQSPAIDKYSAPYAAIVQCFGIQRAGKFALHVVEDIGHRVVRETFEP